MPLRHLGLLDPHLRHPIQHHRLSLAILNLFLRHPSRVRQVTATRSPLLTQPPCRCRSMVSLPHLRRGHNTCLLLRPPRIRTAHSSIRLGFPPNLPRSLIMPRCCHNPRVGFTHRPRRNNMTPRKEFRRLPFSPPLVSHIRQSHPLRQFLRSLSSSCTSRTSHSPLGQRGNSNSSRHNQDKVNPPDMTGNYPCECVLYQLVDNLICHLNDGGILVATCISQMYFISSAQMSMSRIQSTVDIYIQPMHQRI
jgi:hypothetical protein